MQDAIKAIRDLYFPSKNTEEENKKLCERFPFLAWYGDPLYMGYSEENGPNYKYTWEDEVPEGWRKAFCPQMWEDLKEILTRNCCVDGFRFVQIKEKFGELRLYCDCSDCSDEAFQEIVDWEERYLELSRNYCIHCGKPAKYMSLGWISPWCEDCAKEINDAIIDINDVEEYYNTPREERQKFYKKFEEKTND